MTAATNTTLGEVKLAGDLLAGEASAPTLRPSGVKSGTYNVTNKVYVDAQGRVTWAKQLPTDFAWPTASKTTYGVFQIGKNIDINTEYETINVPKATADVKGVVKIGAGLIKNETTNAIDVVVLPATTTSFGTVKPDNDTLQVDVDGVLSVNGQTFVNDKGHATDTNPGGIKVGTNFAVTSDTLHTDFPLATGSVEGLVQAGSHFAIDNGYLTAPIANGSTTAGLIGNENTDFYIDPSTGAIGVNQVSGVEHGHLWGVSGPNIFLNDVTHTLSCNQSFNDFSGDATASVAGKVQVGDRIDVDGNGVISLPVPTNTTYGVFKVTGRNFKIINNALTWDTNFHADTTYLGHARPDNTTITLVNGTTGEIAANFNAVANASYGGYGFMQAGTGINVSSGVISVPDATDSSKGLVQVGANLTVSNGTVSVPVANPWVKGVVKIGTGLVNNNGEISMPQFSNNISPSVVTIGDGLNITDGRVDVPDATSTTFGIVKVGSGMSMNNGSLSIADATTSTKGIVKIGSGLTANNGVVSVTNYDNIIRTNINNNFVYNMRLSGATKIIGSESVKQLQVYDTKGQPTWINEYYISAPFSDSHRIMYFNKSSLTANIDWGTYGDGGHVPPILPQASYAGLKATGYYLIIETGSTPPQFNISWPLRLYDQGAYGGAYSPIGGPYYYKMHFLNAYSNTIILNSFDMFEVIFKPYESFVGGGYYPITIKHIGNFSSI